MKIDLSRLENRYIDLGGEARNVLLFGHYKGERIVFKRARGVVMSIDAVIESADKEDAIYFLGDVEGLRLIGTPSNRIIDGAVSFQAGLYESEMQGLNILYPHTGIRATNRLPHKNVTIKDCYIVGARHEGIYIGPSYATNQPGKGIKVHNNRIIASGWDAVQVGNCKAVYVWDNYIDGAGLKCKYGQDYAFTFNPNSEAWHWNNEIKNAKKGIQSLDSRVFDHIPDNWEK